MPRAFTVKHTMAGPFRKGDVVTEQAIKAAGYPLDHWLAHQAVEEVAFQTIAPSVHSTDEDEAGNTGGDGLDPSTLKAEHLLAEIDRIDDAAELQRILDAEESGKNRTSVTGALREKLGNAG